VVFISLFISTGDKKGVKRKRALPLPASYMEGEDDEEDRIESSDLLPNHTEELESVLHVAESDSKPKVKTKTICDDPLIIRSPECRVTEDGHDATRTVSETCRSDTSLVNHVDNVKSAPPAVVVEHIVSTVPDETCIVMRTATEAADDVLVPSDPSAIVNYTSEEVVLTECKENASTLSNENLPVVEQAMEEAPSVIIPSDDDDTSPSGIVQESTAASVVLLQSPVQSSTLNDVTDQATTDLRDSVATKIKCEVEDTLNDVKRDAFFAGTNCIFFFFFFLVSAFY